MPRMIRWARAALVILPFLLGCTSLALAQQSTAQPVVTGYLDTSGCPAGQTVCFKQFGAGGASSVTANITGINGVAPAVGNGSTNTGTQRVTISSDSTGHIGVNQDQVNGVAVSVGSGLSGTGTQRTTEAAAAPTSSSALAANTVVCGGACQLTSFDVSADSTLSGAAWWIMVYNLTSAPADGAVTPSKCYAMPSGSTGIAAAFPVPLNMTTGAVIGVSTTGCFSKTASTHGFISGDAR